ncbi:MAG: tetratricopeptide repeat protein [Treponema sp.]|nr:tetratricopeptide repeat protein [Treponema sp.]
MFNRRKACILVVLAAISSNLLFSYELTFKLTPGAFFPFVSGGQNFDVVGFDGIFSTGVNFNNVLNVGPDFGFFLVPKKNPSELREDVPKNISVIPVGLHLEGTWYPASRMEVNAGVSLGVGMAMNGRLTDYSPWGRAYGGAAFRINPQWSIGLEASFFAYQSHAIFGMPSIGGPSIGLSVKFKLDTEKITGKVEARIEQDEDIFPLMASLYKENSFGTIYIENNESAEIHDVKVYFRTENFTSSDLFCGEVGLILKRDVAEVPLVADFNERIMMFSEAGDIPGEIVIEYSLLGQKRTAVESVIVSVYNRNQLRWTDPNALAAFIAPKSPASEAVFTLAKYLVGVGRNEQHSGLNRNLQYSMYVFEGMRLSGVDYKQDNATPYSTSHLDEDVLDYIQYPYQTLLYKSGDVDDIGLLFMTMLASVGIDCGFIPLNDDFIVMIDLNMKESEIANSFDGKDRIIVMDGRVMVPVSMSTVREGFVNSWYNAIEEIMAAAANEEDVTYYDLNEAATYYPPASINTTVSAGDRPLETPLVASVETDMSRYITTEFGPQIAAIQNQLAANGISVELLNKLGLLYVRAGMYSSAIPVYERSAAMGSVGAMNNLGNIAMLQKRYQEAKIWYERALAIDPKNSTALRGLNQALGYLED